MQKMLNDSMINFNLHTHSNFCDGTGNPEDYVQSAIRKNFHTLGFSSHAPVPFRNNFAIKDEESLIRYCHTINNLKDKYRDRITVYLALEMDYIEGISCDFCEIKEKYGLDYTIGSVHLVRNGDDRNLWFIDGPKVESYDDGLKQVFSGDIRKAVTTYYEQVKKMVVTQKPGILGHFDKVKMHNRDRYFKEDEGWYRNLVMDLLETISRTGVIPEVNTRGIYKKRSTDLYPGLWVLKEMKKKHIPVTLSADAHHPDEIDGYYAEAIKILKETGYKTLLCLENGHWKDFPI